VRKAIYIPDMDDLLKDESTPGSRRYHSVPHIAREIDMTDAMVYKLIAEGVLEAIRYRRMIRVTDESYQNFLAALKGEPKPAA